MSVQIEERVRLADRAFFGHPRGLGWLSFTEVWERFSYYGMQTLLVLYMTHQLLLPGHVEHIAGFAVFRHIVESVTGPLSSQALGSQIFGLYAGLVWFTPILGGLLADRLTGRTFAIVGGAILMVIGHFLMAFEQSFLIALTCLLIGVGCFKGNLAGQVGSLYAPGDTRAGSAFQIYYLGIQIAVVITPLVCGTLGELYGWHWGFATAGVGMLGGLLIYLRGRRWLAPEPPRGRAAKESERYVMTTRDWRNVAVMVALLPMLAAVTIPSNQVANAYVIWAETTLKLDVFGLRVPVTWLQSLDSIGTSSMILVSLWLWARWSTRQSEPDEMSKIALFGAICGLSPLILAAASWQAAVSGHRVGLGWAVFYEAVMTFGWVNVAPVATALYSRHAPRPIASTILGVYYLQIFLSNVLVGWLGSFLERMSGMNFWLMHAAIAGGAAVILLLVRAPVARWLAPASEHSIANV